MFKELETINHKPKPFQFYTAHELWTDEHTSKRMLEFHLDPSIDAASRNRDFIDRSVSWIMEHFNLGSDARILDLGCGPGQYTNRFAKRSCSVTGVDFSKRSLDYARKVAVSENLSTTYVHGNYLEFKTTERFDLITMIMCDFCALGPDQRKILLEKIRDLLLPDGRLLLDVYSLNAFAGKEESASYEFNLMAGFWSPSDYYCFLNSFTYPLEKVTLDKYTIIEPEQTRVVYNWLQYFDEKSLRKEFEQCGLEITEMYSDVSGQPFDSRSDEMAAVAQKN